MIVENPKETMNPAITPTDKTPEPAKQNKEDMHVCKIINVAHKQHWTYFGLTFKINV